MTQKFDLGDDSDEIIGRGTWIDKLALSVLERKDNLKGKHPELIRTESGLGASGFPHIGSFADASRAFGFKLAIEDLFLLCIVILLVTSILSGFLDNVPVTVIFIPIIQVLIIKAGFDAAPLLIAFILGINLGGNFLPQGSACDMMTLELAKRDHIHEMNYNKLLKVGGSFALLHVLIGIGYLWFYIYVLL